MSLEDGLHCCSAPESRPVLLACDASASDVISDVTFASFGVSGPGGSVCGKEVSHPCSAQVGSIIKEKCIGRRTCQIDEALLGNPCPLAKGRRVLTVRWTCSQDESANTFSAQLPKLPLRVHGSIIVNADGQRVRLKGVNWSGAHDWRQVPAGLDRAPLQSIARRVREMGFNFVRLTFALETWKNNPEIWDHTIAANPGLQGLNALTIFDKVIAALQREGVMVWLDNHMLDADWCCHDKDCNGLWFNVRYQAAEWIEMWKSMSQRYSNVSAVVGMGLKNEPHRVCVGRSWGGEGMYCDLDFLNVSLDVSGCAEPSWSAGPSHLQYKIAVENAGRAILEKSPHMLVSFCGLDYATKLAGIAADLPDLPSSNLVLEAHDYSWHHPEHHVWDDLHACTLEKNWGHILRNGVAPVIMSEFGMSHTWQDSNYVQRWFQNVADYVQGSGPLNDRGGLDWAYWQLSGLQVSGTSRREGDIESFGVMNDCWTGAAAGPHLAAIQRLMSPPASASIVSRPLDCAERISDSGGFQIWHVLLIAGGVVLACSFSLLLLRRWWRNKIRNASATQTTRALPIVVGDQQVVGEQHDSSTRRRSLSTCDKDASANFEKI